MAQKKSEKMAEEDSRYHDAWKLLKKYRDIVWSLELSVLQVKKKFQVEYEPHSVHGLPRPLPDSAALPARIGGQWTA